MDMLHTLMYVRLLKCRELLVVIYGRRLSLAKGGRPSVATRAPFLPLCSGVSMRGRAFLPARGGPWPRSPALKMVYLNACMHACMYATDWYILPCSPMLACPFVPPPCLALPCLALPCLVLPCVLSCLALSCLASCLALPYRRRYWW